MAADEGYGAFLAAAARTAAVALVVFGISHMAFISWAVPDRSGDATLVGRLAVMLVAPMMVGLPFAMLAAVANGLVWRLARRTRLASWRYGVALASALAPAVVVAALHGPYGEELPERRVLAAVLAATLALPAVPGTLWGGAKGALVGVASLPLVVPWGVFILAAGVHGWVIPFVGSVGGILLGSGWLMERLAPPGPGASPAPLAPAGARPAP